MSTVASIMPSGIPFIARRTRAYFAPVNRSVGQPATFTPELSSKWQSNAPSAPWVDLGWIYNLVQTSTSKIVAVQTGSPSTVRTQVRSDLGAIVSCSFASWTKLTMALTSGSEHMNILASATVNGQGTGTEVKAISALALQLNSTSTTLYVASTAIPTITPGNIVVVDNDYDNELGFIGAGVSGAYIQSPRSAELDIDYARRVSFNVARVISVGNDGGLRLATPLIAGTPTTTMKVQRALGFVDREGGSFFQEWSGLFLVEGLQGELLFFYYPRLQACESSKEVSSPLSTSLNVIQLNGSFRALPTIDKQDGQAVVCYKFFYPSTYACI